MSRLIFYKYNNYFDRALKGESNTNISSYSSFSPWEMTYTENGQEVPYNVNFDFKDGIDTVHYINAKNGDNVANLVGKDLPYNYMLVADTNGTIQSKWFIIDAPWERKWQWRVVLHRDVLADFYNKYKDEPFYCRKGFPGKNSILTYNSEGMQFNQILKETAFLKQGENEDNRWLIGFVDKKWNGGTIYKSPTMDSKESFKDLPIYEALLNGKQEIPARRYITLNVVQAAAPTPPTTTGGPGTSVWMGLRTDDSGMSTKLRGNNEFSIAGSDSSGTFVTILSTINSTLRPLVQTTLTSYDDSIRLSLIEDGIISIDKDNYWDDAVDTGTRFEKYVNISGKAYTLWRSKTATTINVQVYTPTNSAYKLPLSTKKSLLEAFASAATTAGYNGWCDTTNDTYVESDVTYGYSADVYNVGYEARTGGITFSQPNTTISTNPYNIFCIVDNNTTRDFIGWLAQYGGEHIYDIQLFPYHPKLYNEAGSEKIAFTITSGGTTYNAYWAKSDSASGTLYTSFSKSYATTPDKKAGANMDMCRILSPNGASAWDFNPATIGGVNYISGGQTVNPFRYEFTLIPFNSYLHIFPTFGEIYGSLNKPVSGSQTLESRGLVCSGPWSIPYSSSNWQDYQINNSAWSDSFSRQIENMTTVQDVERTKEKWSAVLNSVNSGIQGGTSGAIAGAMAGSGGGPAGAIIGGVVGGVAGTVAGAAGGFIDMHLNEKLRAEQINYTKDQFYNSLRNIQAQPNPLKHNNTITIGNSKFPCIQYYSADIDVNGIPTDEMKTYFLNDLRIHGWAMNVPTTFQTVVNAMYDYDGDNIESSPTRYIQGDLVNTEGLDDDYHIAKEIAKELNLGVYIWQI